MSSLSHISIVLVQTAYPENIGSVARVMKNMGLQELVLIKPAPYKIAEAYALAHKSKDILDNALVYNDLEEALSPFTLIVGTTQRVRGAHYPLYAPREIADEIKAIGNKKKIALVFGRESRGLTNEELRKCHIISTVSTAVDQPSINLAQAVMVFCYEIYQQTLDGGNSEPFEWDLAENREIQFMYQHLEKCLEAIKFYPRGDIENFIDRFRRVLGRVKLEKRDLKLFHKLYAEVERAMRETDKSGGE
jgi:TrmH family RNA methyltransferase